MSEKQSKIKKLLAGIEVRDRIIGILLKSITENKIEIPSHVLTIVKELYKDKLNETVKH